MVLRKLKNHSVLFGMIFTVASLLACFIFTWVIYEDEIFARMKEYLFDCGVDVMGAFTCAALYYGSMRQEGEGAKDFSCSDRPDECRLCGDRPYPDLFLLSVCQGHS